MRVPNVAATRAVYNHRVRRSPNRTASVRLPAARSVGMSRRLLTTSSAQATNPAAQPMPMLNPVISSTLTYVVPAVATSPKNAKTNTSPSPRYPYGRGPPVYPHAAAMLATPTATSHQDVDAARAKPATAATPNAANAARLTATGDARPDATRRTGPTRPASVPRTPSE